MINKDSLVAYLYDECEPAERQRIEEHVQACGACLSELNDLRAVRASLSAWTPPERSLGFSIIQPAAAAPRSRHWWSRQIPAWAQAAAAVVLFGAGAAIANLEVRYDRDGLTVRTGWQRGGGTNTAPSRAAAQPAARASTTMASPWRSDLVALERRLRDELAEMKTASGPAVPSRSSARPAAPALSTAELGVGAAAANGLGAGAPASNMLGVGAPASNMLGVGAPASSNALLQRVRRMIETSEEKQQRELALRLAEVVRDFDTQRHADLLRIDQGLGQLEGQTGAAVAQQRELLNYLVRVSQRK